MHHFPCFVTRTTAATSTGGCSRRWPKHTEPPRHAALSPEQRVRMPLPTPRCFTSAGDVFRHPVGSREPARRGPHGQMVSRIPLQVFRHGPEPVGCRVARTDGRQGIIAHLDQDGIAGTQGLAALAVEGDPRRIVALLGHSYLQPDGIRKGQRPERQGVGADGREQYAGHLWVHHGSASSERIGRGSGRRGHDQAIPSHICHKHVIAVALQVGQVRRHSTIDDHIIQHQVPLLHRGAAPQALDIFRMSFSYDAAGQPVPQGDRRRRIQETVQCILAIPVVVGAHEAQRAQPEGHERRDSLFREQGGRPQDRAVAPQDDPKVGDDLVVLALVMLTSSPHLYLAQEALCLLLGQAMTSNYV
mmetsp:Transcript_12354/g.45060  ORF Transcript_12354/g.45060 Transcript_12354/m.45060 type:complete len:359 (-) Transcript_12354:1066-2142(-)